VHFVNVFLNNYQLLHGHVEHKIVLLFFWGVYVDFHFKGNRKIEGV